jgi:protein-disulfide isomerase
MHNSLFADQKELDPVSLAHRFEALGGDMRQFSSCVEAPETEAKVLSDSAMATELGLTLTPTFFAGIIQADGQVKVSKVIVGTKPLTDFTSVIDALLK